jgi:hypothetical protein
VGAGEREGKQLGCRSPQAPQECASGEGLLHFAAAFAATAGAAQWLQDLQTPVAAWVAETVGDSLTSILFRSKV